MQLPCAIRLIVPLLLSACPLISLGFGQIVPSAVPSEFASAADALESLDIHTPASSQPRVGIGHTLTYAGVYSSDGKFRAPSKWDRFRTKKSDSARQKFVPPRMLQSGVRAFEDFDAPAHRVSTAEAHSLLGSALDSVVTFVYGGRTVLESPFQVATDSKHRLIVSDPARHSVDVLDPKGKTSFTILGGDGHRLQLPAGVAVDAHDNIYIADSARGMLLVYDRNGVFLRYIGQIHGENWYVFPTGVAIDRKAGHLFVADSPRNLIFMLDLEGNVLKRLGTDKRVGKIGIELEFPTRIAVNQQEIVVLDTGGSRVQVMDRDCNLLQSFTVPKAQQLQANEGGLALDQAGNIYLSDPVASTLTLYSPEGRLLATFGQKGYETGEFDSPQGLWVDEGSHIYIAEKENARVQVFQLMAH